jgi:hypothetical protein
MPAPSNVQKAYLQIEGQPNKLECWFNPKEYSVSRNNNWKTDAIPGAPLPHAQFLGSNAHDLTINLLFDDSDSHDGSVEKVCNRLIQMMEPDKKFGTAAKNSARPPLVEFGWGAGLTPAFLAACKQLQIKYSLFNSQGVPIRADVTLQLTQVDKAIPGGTSGQEKRQNPTTTGLAGLRSHRVRDGDSLQSISYAAYGDATQWRTIAEANGIDDPTRLRRGSVLTIPPLGE